MHLKRWLTSILLLPLVAFLIYRGGAPFFLLIGVVCVISLWEYFSIAFHHQTKNNGMVYVGMVIGFVIILAAHQGSLNGILWLSVLNLFLCAVISVVMSETNSSFDKAVSRQVHGMVYIPLFLAFLVLIRNQANGATWVLFVLCIIFAGDTGAYYVGTYAGKRKLAPRLSPGKTVEGAFGGIGANVGLGVLINYLLPVLPWGMDMQRLPWGRAILFFIVIGAVGQLGDLYESQLKRTSGVKDSGKTLPGHGGFLDRIDALLFAAPAAYFFKMAVF